MKKIIFFKIILLLFSISFINSKDYNNKQYKFGFDFNKKYCSFYSPDLKLLDNEESKKYKIFVTIKKIDDLPEDSPSGVNIKEYFIDKKRLLEKGKFIFNKVDEISSVNMHPIIKRTNNANYVSYVSFSHSGGWGDANYVKEIEGEILFFKNNHLLTIKIRFLKGFLPKDIKDKSEIIYNKYFKAFKESWGAEFKNDNSAKELYNDIINMDKKLPEDLLLFYKCFKQIVDTLEIK